MSDTNSTSKGFIPNPQTIQEFAHNAKFQLDNVEGWMIVKDYESALIKARCLVDALEKLVQHKQSKPITNE